MTGGSTLVFYCTDAGFLFPTLVSARALRQQTRAAFDLRIFVVDLAPAAEAAARRAAAAIGAEVVALSSASFAPERPVSSDPMPYLPQSALARLAVGPHIEPRHARLLYIDGDTVPVADLAPLIESAPPAGGILAAPDPSNHWRNDPGRVGRDRAAYCASLGLGAADTYFNSGVLLVARDTWIDVAAEALAYYRAHPERCRYRDQSALNAVARGRFVPLSSRWNFSQPLRAWGLDGTLRPRLYHFTGPGKPWRGPLSPWRDFWPLYRDAAADPLLGPFAPAPEAWPRRMRAEFGYALWAARALVLHHGRAEHARAGVLGDEAGAALAEA